MKRNICYITFLLFIICNVSIYAKDNKVFRFDSNGKFKIAQFTDIHWNQKSPNCKETTATIKHVLITEKPDIAILTGDVVTAAPAQEGWLAIAKIFEEMEMPWAVLLGNHDAEMDLTRRDIFNLIDNMPYYVGEIGPEELTGSGNFSLAIERSKNSAPAAILYCIDSNDYPANPKYGHYDWIHFDQIDWFRKQSILNKGIPSLAFFHIPITEFNEIVGKETTIGIKNEGVASADINSGFFNAMLESGDIMGAFVGHDHNNDYIGLHHDIALAFGRTTGANAYGDLERGARIILLYEGQQKFDTWIRTKKGTDFMYYYPSGLSKNDEDTMIYHPAKNVKVKEQGISYSYHEGGKLKKIADIDTNTKLVKTGTLNNFALTPAIVKDSFAFVFKGLINIKERGVYRFYTNSDDGSVLYIDGKMVVDNDGSHSVQRVDGKIALEAGLHDIEVRYIENYMGEELEVGWVSRNIREEKIPDNVLFISE